MKPSELYKMKPEEITKNIDCLWGCYYSHIPEIEHLYIDAEKNERVKIHTYKYFCFDGRRIWHLAAVKFDDKFVMIIQNAGREGDDHAAPIVTVRTRS